MVAVLAGDPSQATVNVAATSALALFDYLVAFSVLHRQVGVAGSVPLVRTKQIDRDLGVRRVVASPSKEPGATHLIRATGRSTGPAQPPTRASARRST